MDEVMPARTARDRRAQVRASGVEHPRVDDMADDVPAAGRVERIHGGVLRRRSRGTARRCVRRGVARRGSCKPVIEPGEIREAGRKAHCLDDVVGRRVELARCRRRRRLSSSATVVEIDPVVDALAARCSRTRLGELVQLRELGDARRIDLRLGVEIRRDDLVTRDDDIVHTGPRANRAHERTRRHVAGARTGSRDRRARTQSAIDRLAYRTRDRERVRGIGVHADRVDLTSERAGIRRGGRAGSVISASGSLRGTSEPSGRVLRSAKPSRKIALAFSARPRAARRRRADDGRPRRALARARRSPRRPARGSRAAS